MTECLIIGSGIVGLITAYELRKSGCKITVIESRRSGQASKSAAGILFPINPWEKKKSFVSDSGDPPIDTSSDDYVRPYPN